MLTLTARKHLNAAIRARLLISHKDAAAIIIKNIETIDVFLTVPALMKDAFVVVGNFQSSRSKASLNVYAGGQFRFALTCDHHHLDKWHRLPLDKAYPEIPGKAEYDALIKSETVHGVLSDVREHPVLSGALVLEVETDDKGTQTYLNLPMPWHRDGDLRSYVMQFYRTRQRFELVAASYCSACIDGVPDGCDSDEQVVEFIMSPLWDKMKLAA